MEVICLWPPWLTGSYHPRYQPRYNGVRPSWGWFVRYAKDVTIVTSSLSTAAADGRPAVVVDAVEGLSVFGARAAGGGSHCQLALRNVTGHWEGTELRPCAWRPSSD